MKQNLPNQYYRCNTTDAIGTIIGLNNRVRNWLFHGMAVSSAKANNNDNITTKGTATTEKRKVLPAAN